MKGLFREANGPALCEGKGRQAVGSPGNNIEVTREERRARWAQSAG